MNILQSAASLPVIDHRWTHLHADRCTRLLSIDETRFVCGWPRPQRSGEKRMRHSTVRRSTDRPLLVLEHVSKRLGTFLILCVAVSGSSTDVCANFPLWIEVEKRTEDLFYLSSSTQLRRFWMSFYVFFFSFFCFFFFYARACCIDF